jgi:uncharacterized protein YjbI with pentapeptide repeats
MEQLNPIDILLTGVDAWNTWRKQHLHLKIDIYRAPLMGLDLEGIDLNNISLEGADLTGTNLSSARCQNTNFREACFSGTNLMNTNFSGAKLDKIDFSHARLSATRFDGAEMYKCNFMGAALTKATFIGTNLKYANFKNSFLLGANFCKAVVDGARFDGADLSDGNFEESRCDATSFQGARLDRTDFHKAYLLHADFTQANLTTNLQRQNLTGYSFFTIEMTRFRHADLRRAKFNDVIAPDVNFDFANLENAQLISSNLTKCWFEGANLSGADFTASDLTDSHLIGTNLTYANLTSANLANVDLSRSILIESNITNTSFHKCRIYGVSAWNLKGLPKKQTDLIITPSNEAEISVDDLQVAQFIYLLLNRENLRRVLNTITSKAVLILGRFTPERKIILDRIAEELRMHNLLPIIFDFDRLTSRDLTETIKTLAGISLFIIADLSNPKSSPLELQAIVPDYQIPLVPIIQAGEQPFSMLSDLIGKYNWVVDPVLTYTSGENLSKGFKTAILDRAWKKHLELQAKKMDNIKTLSIEDFVK